MKNYNFVVLCFLLVTSLVTSQVFFENQASSLGLEINTGNSTPHGSGISFYDFDNDGWDDITLGTEDQQSLRFFKNTNGVFSEVFINISLINTQNKQVLWVDFDNDGDKDLFSSSIKLGNKLYRNDGGFNFTDITLTSGLPNTNIFTSGATWGDYNNDGYLDLFLTSYDFSLNEPNYLYENNGDGTFTDVSVTAGILPSSDLSFCATFFDYNNDGWQDIYVSNDRLFTENILYKNNGDETFTDVSEVSNTGIAINAMTTTIGDYNNDGWFDIYVTNTSEGNVFFKNNGDGTFTDVAAMNGTLFESIAWGSVFLDADNDTDLDLYVSGSLNGNGDFMSAAFYENNGSGIYSIPGTAGFIGDTSSSYSNAVGDIDNNGLADIIVNNSDDEDVFIWKNLTATTNNWLKVKLEGVQSNKDGIGSVIEISINGEKQYRYTACGEGYLSQNSSTEFFGLGGASTVDYLKVTWLSGIVDVINDVSANQVLEIQEGSETLSTDQLKKSFTVDAFPNPVTDEISINSNFDLKCVKITNILGQVLYEENNIFESKFTLDMSYLSSGIYNVIFTSQEKEVIKKVIKQ